MIVLSSLKFIQHRVTKGKKEIYIFSFIFIESTTCDLISFVHCNDSHFNSERSKIVVII